MAHEEAWQWTPDLLWFNNLEAYGSANYYVQQLFATNKGTDLITITNNGKTLTGQNNLYASVVKDSNTKEVIIKLVNTASIPQEVNLTFKGIKLATKGTKISLTSPNLEDENSFANPKKISPREEPINTQKNLVKNSLSAYSVNIIKIKY
jgi:alpha-N-arabinofuranosidase